MEWKHATQDHPPRFFIKEKNNSRSRGRPQRVLKTRTRLLCQLFTKISPRYDKARRKRDPTATAPFAGDGGISLFRIGGLKVRFGHFIGRCLDSLGLVSNHKVGLDYVVLQSQKIRQLVFAETKICYEWMKSSSVYVDGVLCGRSSRCTRKLVDATTPSSMFS